MAGAHPRIVGDVDVAFVHAVDGEMPQKMLHRFGHGVDVTRSAGHRLGKHPPSGIEHTRREIAALAHDGAEGGAHQRLRLLLHHGNEAVPHDLHADGFKRACFAHA